MGDVEIFVDDCRGWHIWPRDQFIGAATQDLEHRLVQTVHLPFLTQLAIDQSVDFHTPRIHARDDIIEEIGVGIGILRVFNFLPQTVRMKFIQKPRDTDVFHIHLI